MLSKRVNGMLVVATVVYGLSFFTSAAAQPVRVAKSPESLLVSPEARPLASLHAKESPEIEVSTETKWVKRVVERIQSQPSLSAQPRSVLSSNPVTGTVAPTVTVTSAPTSLPTILTVQYRIELPSGDVVGTADLHGVSVGEGTKQIAASRNLSFVYEATEMGWFVSEISGVRQSPRTGHYWLFYVNGQLANKASDQVLLKAGDSLVWKYEKAN